MIPAPTIGRYIYPQVRQSESRYRYFLYQNPDTPVLLEKEWDLTDNHGLTIQSGIIYVCFEAANIIKYASDEVVTITSEQTATQVNLNSQQTAPASATQHILELTVTFQ